MYDHIGLKVKDLDASVRFYEAALAPLGHVLDSRDDSGASERSPPRAARSPATRNPASLLPLAHRRAQEVAQARAERSAAGDGRERLTRLAVPVAIAVPAGPLAPARGRARASGGGSGRGCRRLHAGEAETDPPVLGHLEDVDLELLTHLEAAREVRPARGARAFRQVAEGREPAAQRGGAVEVLARPDHGGSRDRRKRGPRGEPAVARVRRLEVPVLHEPRLGVAHHLVLARADGWPLRSLGGISGHTRKLLNVQAPFGRAILRAMPLNSDKFTNDIRFLPLQPLWPGFAINTVFYAGVLWIVFCGPFALRQLIRRRRGQCARCAYPIGSSAVCTECGAPHEAV